MWAAPCYLCRKRVGTEHLRGYSVCSQCCYTYESLVHAVRVQPDNLYIQEALKLANDRLDKNSSLGALTSYAAAHWKDDVK